MNQFRRRSLNNPICFNKANRYLLDIGGGTGHTMAICESHYMSMTIEALRPWNEITLEEYEVSKVHES
jgi:hypothetical protein